MGIIILYYVTDIDCVVMKIVFTDFNKNFKNESEQNDGL